MTAVTEISKFRAKLDGKVVRLKPVTTKSIRGGKIYMRFCENYVELVRTKGGAVNNTPSWLRKKYPDGYKGKTHTMATHLCSQRSSDYYFFSDMGCDDVKHGRHGARLFEFSNKGYLLLKAMTNMEQAARLMDRGQNCESWEDEFFNITQ